MCVIGAAALLYLPTALLPESGYRRSRRSVWPRDGAHDSLLVRWHTRSDWCSFKAARAAAYSLHGGHPHLQWHRALAVVVERLKPCPTWWIHKGRCVAGLRYGLLLRFQRHNHEAAAVGCWVGIHQRTGVVHVTPSPEPVSLR